MNIENNKETPIESMSDDAVRQKKAHRQGLATGFLTYAAILGCLKLLGASKYLILLVLITPFPILYCFVKFNNLWAGDKRIYEDFQKLDKKTQKNLKPLLNYDPEKIKENSSHDFYVNVTYEFITGFLMGGALISIIPLIAIVYF